MNKLPPMGKRLSTLLAMVDGEYAHIWDCCCDHGLLGAALLQRYASSQLHFVDTSTEIVQQLTDKLAHFYPQHQHRYQLYTMDAAAIPLSKYSQQQLVIIAGVGGDLCAELVTDITRANPQADVDFLLCPVHHSYMLRQQLTNLGFGCLQEVLIEENQRFYEALLVRPGALKQALLPISATGTAIWQVASQAEQEQAQSYLHKLLAHYQRVAKGKNVEAEVILKAYQQVKIAVIS